MRDLLRLLIVDVIFLRIHCEKKRSPVFDRRLEYLTDLEELYATTLVRIICGESINEYDLREARWQLYELHGIDKLVNEGKVKAA